MPRSEDRVDVEQYQFEPIKGYPMLSWKGKRPFSSTQYFPAQIKETYGEEINNWINKIYWGDNLQVLSHLLKEYRGKINLIYIDPPFDSKADYRKKIKLKGKSVENDQNSFEEKQYTDIWTNDEYLQFMYERLIMLRELLTENGSIIIHCDWHKVHHLRCIADEIFGSDNFRNEIVWCYGGGGAPKKAYPSKHDNLLWYSKGSSWTFNKQYRPYSEGTLERGLTEVKGDYTLDDQGAMLNDWWAEKEVQKILSPTAYENLKYPTQKPLGLLRRIINGHSNPGDIILDCFMGSGTTLAASMELGRRFIGADINKGSIETTTKRLIKLSNDLQDNSGNDKFFKGFQVYNVNNYDIFRNPAQAKELLLEALEIQKLSNNSLYDGEKDGRLVKIMPVNRISTRADLNELITNFDYKLFERRQLENPTQPVERILLVCMGHEPDLAAALEQEVGYKLDIEVVDILRDKSQLEFKRDSEVEIITDNERLIIKNFYPMNLLQKLSIMKEGIEDWKVLVESILIDWNYDGAVLEPSIIDIPERRELVKGEYIIPPNAGNIRVKITDLLSEVLEVTINNG